MKIFLVGYMGSGKSTIASVLANLLDMEAIDTDVWIEQKYGRSIPNIFEVDGEEKFREMERICLESILKSKGDLLVATGGGLPCFSDNMHFINDHAISVYLMVSIKDIVDRIKGSKRPLVVNRTKKSLTAYVRNHLGTRRQYYQQAHIKVWNTDTPEKVAERIIKKIKRSRSFRKIEG